MPIKLVGIDNCYTITWKYCKTATQSVKTTEEQTQEKILVQESIYLFLSMFKHSH